MVYSRCLVHCSSGRSSNGIMDLLKFDCYRTGKVFNRLSSIVWVITTLLIKLGYNVIRAKGNVFVKARLDNLAFFLYSRSFLYLPIAKELVGKPVSLRPWSVISQQYPHYLRFNHQAFPGVIATAPLRKGQTHCMPRFVPSFLLVGKE